MPTELRALMLLAALGLSPTAQALLAGTAPDAPQAREIRIAPASRWAGVGEVLTPVGRFGGVAVASDLVLTAAHVAARYADHPGQVHFQAAAGIPVAVAHIAVMPAYRFPSHDLALLTLARPLPDAVPRYALLDRPLQPGDVIEFVAAGRSGRGDTGPDTPATPGSSVTVGTWSIGWASVCPA